MYMYNIKYSLILSLLFYIKIIYAFTCPLVSLNMNYNWNKNWYPIAFDKYTDKTKPFSFNLLGESLVVWWDHKTKKWNSMKNQCPHKLVPLSEGRINENGNIECPYHGWSFNGQTGKCNCIPHTFNKKITNNKYSQGKAYYTTLKQDLIWIWPEIIENNKIYPDENLIPIYKTLENKNIIYEDTFIDLPYDYTIFFENVLDISHIPFTHHGSQGNRKWGKSINYKIINKVTDKGFSLKFNTSKSKAETFFKAPCSQYSKFNSKYLKTHIVSYATPTIEGKCRAFARLPVLDIKLPYIFVIIIKFFYNIKPTFLKHMFINKVIEEDNIFLHIQEKELNNKLNKYFLPTITDMPTILWRKWLNESGNIPWVNKNIEKKYINLQYNKYELLDRENTHLKHCIVCQNANKNLYKIKKYTLLLLSFTSIFGTSLIDLYFPTYNQIIKKTILWFLIIILGNMWFIFNILQDRLIKGPYPPTRNL